MCLFAIYCRDQSRLKVWSEVKNSRKVEFELRLIRERKLNLNCSKWTWDWSLKWRSEAMATATKFIQRLRNFFAGRDLQPTYNNRYAYGQSPRTQPDPTLPDGPSHRLSANYYCTRDGRREVQPPVPVFSTQQRLPAPESEGAGISVRKPVTPGIPPPAMKLSTDEPYLWFIEQYSHYYTR